MNHKSQQYLEIEIGKLSPSKSLVGRTSVTESRNLPNRISGIQEIVKDPTMCPHCGISSSGLTVIQSVFGMRNMGDGTVRAQSWCRECRKNSSVDSRAI